MNQPIIIYIPFFLFILPKSSKKSGHAKQEKSHIEIFSKNWNVIYNFFSICPTVVFPSKQKHFEENLTLKTDAAFLPHPSSLTKHFFNHLYTARILGISAMCRYLLIHFTSKS